MSSIKKLFFHYTFSFPVLSHQLLLQLNSPLSVQCPWAVSTCSDVTGLVLHPQGIAQTSRAPLRASPQIYAKYIYTEESGLGVGLRLPHTDHFQG